MRKNFGNERPDGDGADFIKTRRVIVYEHVTLTHGDRSERHEYRDRRSRAELSCDNRCGPVRAGAAKDGGDRAYDADSDPDPESAWPGRNPTRRSCGGWGPRQWRGSAPTRCSDHIIDQLRP